MLVHMPYMYKEMEEVGLPEPEYKPVSFMVHATIKCKNDKAYRRYIKNLNDWIFSESGIL